MTFKPLNENDTVNTRTLLHEAIPLTGSIISGSYIDAAVPPNPTNLKSYSHGMFQTVYDYNYLSSSANHVFDVTCGISSQAAKVFGASGMQSKKNNIYGQMAQILMGYDLTGSVQLFDEDGDLLAGGEKMKEVFVLPFSRLLVKDEIKKETFSMKVDVTNYVAAAQPMDPSTGLITISDLGASTEYRVNSPAGEYGILYAADNNSLLDLTVTNDDHKATINSVEYLRCGLIFYQAGIVVLTGSVFGTHLVTALNGTASKVFFNDTVTDLGIDGVFTDNSINDMNEALLHRIENVQFNNTTELNSTVYFCRANHNEFNYSSNPTYLDNSRVRVKTQSTDEPVAYITTVGLYNDRNELLATAKLSEALKKSPSTEFTIRARLDY
jgi:hypothetical protein